MNQVPEKFTNLGNLNINDEQTHVVYAHLQELATDKELFAALKTRLGGLQFGQERIRVLENLSDSVAHGYKFPVLKKTHSVPPVESEASEEQEVAEEQEREEQETSPYDAFLARLREDGGDKVPFS